MRQDERQTAWFRWGQSALALAVALSLAGLAVANIVLHARWHEVEDGVLWSLRPDGVTAVEIADGSPAARAGVQRGDLLLAVNGAAVQTPGDVIEYQHRAHEGTRLAYTLLRLGRRQALEVTLAPVAQSGSMYYVLAAVGLFTLLVGASVRLKRPHDQATLHFFWLCVAFFGAFSFSFNGPLDRLDWVFYWGDALASALLPPLLLHFTLAFPERDTKQPNLVATTIVPLMYLPALLLAAGRIIAVSQGASNGPMFSRAVDALDRFEPLYLFVCAAAALAALVRGFREATSLTARRQLRWIAWGTGIGVSPFAVGYALPWALGANPPFALQLTAIPLGFVPLTFASAIVRYRLRDVEVIVKRALVYTAFFAAAAALCLAILKLAGFVFPNASDLENWVIALLATTVIVLVAQPVRAVMHDVLDRLFYRDRYDYRRALVAFASELNSDLNVERVGQRLVGRIVETLVVDRMALMLATGDPAAAPPLEQASFQSIGDYGFTVGVPPLRRASSFMARLDGGHTVALDDPIAAARYAAEDVEFWRDQGLYYLVPCVFEGAAIAVLALGRKANDEPLNSEDLALLTAVAGQVATAIENGRLYRQLHMKAEELGRMREFNENILESLDDGLVVVDLNDRIVRWNRALERFYGVSRVAAIGQPLGAVFDRSLVDALAAARREQPNGATLSRVPLTARRGDAVQVLVNATVVPLQEPAANRVVGAILLIEDITDRVRLQEQLQISEKMASIGLLAAGVAHEVNTPLTGISSFTQMLLEGADPADPKTTLLEKIERQTFRAAKIVNGLLTLSRPGTGTDRAVVDLNVVVNDVCSLLEHQFEASRIKVRRDLSEAPVLVVGTEHQLQQVFLNLFLNARDAMPKGGWLSVTTHAEDQDVRAEVADTGSGIPPEHLARIYDPFFTTKAIGRGTGLGLSIIYGIIQEHDGTIHCDSAVGQGTRFTMRLPHAEAEQARARTGR